MWLACSVMPLICDKSERKLAFRRRFGGRQKIAGRLDFGSCADPGRHRRS
jgi:hypothetical protein